MKTENCIHCGADRCLHHYQTMQCPVGGVEAPIGRKQEWMNSTYEQRDPVKDAAPAMLDLLERIVAESRPPAFTPHGHCSPLSDATIEEIIKTCNEAGRDTKLQIRE